MDVRCSKCGTEYEFDDAKVTAAGVTVKCTNCGHVFKVKREESASVPGSPSTSFGSAGFQPQSTFAKGIDGGEWMVKRVDGQVFRFKELTTLQKWIVERKVGRDDEISKTGKTWKKLGEIAELASFFQVVDAANAALSASVIPVQPSMPAPNVVQGLVVVPPPSAGTAPPASPSQALSIHDEPTQQIPQQIPQQQPQQQQAAAAHRTPDSRPADPAPSRPTAPTVPVSRQPGRPTGDVDLSDLDDDDPVLQMIKRRRRNAALVVVLFVLLVGGAASAVFWPQLAPVLGLAATAPPSVAADNARKALRTDKLDDIEKARQALRTDKPSAAVTAAAVLLDVAVTSHALEQARIEEALATTLPPAGAAGPPVDHAARAKKLRDDAGAALSNVYSTVNRVRAEAPGLVEAHLASAAYNLEKGGLSEQRADLEAARAAAKKDASAATTDPAAVDAEIAVQQALADVRVALRSSDGTDAKTALDKVPASSTDGRLQYARAALLVAVAQHTKPPADVAMGEAKKAVQALAGDERIFLLQQLLDAITPRAGVSVDGGPALAAQGDAGTGTAASPKGTVVDAGVVVSAPKPPSGGDEEASGGGGNFDVVMHNAEKARVADRSKAAHDLFLKATKLKPSAARAWIGLGWTALDLSKNAEAVKAFRKALDVDGNLADAEFGLAEALRFSGSKSEALDAYKSYLKMDPSGKDAGTAKRAIESLQ